MNFIRLELTFFFLINLEFEGTTMVLVRYPDRFNLIAVVNGCAQKYLKKLANEFPLGEIT